ncbi:MAG: hypothetical protein R2860_14955 [Desulfobacterales bacterium]
MREFAAGLSETTGLMIGKDIDYFQLIKDRLDMYVNAMNQQPDASEPAMVISPEFADACGNGRCLYRDDRRQNVHHYRRQREILFGRGQIEINFPDKGGPYVLHLFCPGMFCLRHRCLDGRQCGGKTKKQPPEVFVKNINACPTGWLAARILFILCAVSFIFGFILLIGSQSRKKHAAFITRSGDFGNHYHPHRHRGRRDKNLSAPAGKSLRWFIDAYRRKKAPTIHTPAAVS